MDIAAFVEAQLPPTPAHVLEIGCGAGDLACAVARLGYRIVAIDPKAPDGDIFESVSLEAFAGRGPFDAAVANRALHHIPDLAGALDKVARLLRPRGRLIVHEHAWERMDEPTARWFLERRETIDPAAPRSVESCLGDWNADHAGLHRSVELRAALDQRFKERLFAWDAVSLRRVGGHPDRAGRARSGRGGQDQGARLHLRRREMSVRLRRDVRSRGCGDRAARNAEPRSQSARSARCQSGLHDRVRGVTGWVAPAGDPGPESAAVDHLQQKPLRLAARDHVLVEAQLTLRRSTRRTSARARC